MLTNRSIPRCTVIPELAYPDIGEAVVWLCNAFGFSLRIRIGDHRAQLNVGDGAVVVTEQSVEAKRTSSIDTTHSVMVRVPDVNLHHERSQRSGARILRSPANYPFGERQYTAEDFAGHRWTFTQSIADVAPEEWGGIPGEL